MAAPAAYYPDPAGDTTKERYWDGAKWDTTTRYKAMTIPEIPVFGASSQGGYSQSTGLEPDDVVADIIPSLPVLSFDHSETSSGIDAFPSFPMHAPARIENNPYSAQLVGAESFNVSPVTSSSLQTAGATLTIKQITAKFKAKQIDKLTYKKLRKEAESKLSNTRFTSRGGLAFTAYLLAYPIVIALGIVTVGNGIGHATSVLSSLDWSIQNIGASISKLQTLVDFGATYTAFRLSLITTVIAVAAIPFVLGIFGAAKKKGRVWAVATILLSLVFNPALVLCGVPTNIALWIIALPG